MKQNNLNVLKDIPILQVANLLKIAINHNLKAICRHGEKDPSLSFNLKTNSFKCFGCSKSGDTIELVKFYTGLNFLESCDWIRNNFNIATNNVTDAYKKPNYKTNNTPTATYQQEPVKQEDIKKHSKIYEYMFHNICNIPEMKKCFPYLISRGFQPETIKRFKLFSIINYQETSKLLKENFDIAELQESGLFNNEEHLIFYRHSLIIPYIKNNRITYLRGRYFFEGFANPENNKTSKYLGLSNKTTKRLFNSDVLKTLKANDKLYLCEGEFDTMLTAQNGYSAVGIPGINSFDNKIIETLSKFDIHLILDNDAAGKKGTENIAEMFYKVGRRVKIVALPANVKDVGEWHNQIKTEVL